jgi:phage I-like protein
MLGEGDPPTAFRLFAAGVNRSEIGDFIFDDKAAALVMGNFRVEGVDQMVDLEHDSLDETTRRMRADAADALGWYRLEVRNGELWAVDVKWGPEGERRLRAKTQRYISPAFLTDDEGRIVEVVNVALCARPATYDAAPLIAARSKMHAGKGPAAKPKRLSAMNPELIAKALEAIAKGDANAALELLKELVSAAASGGEPPEGDPAADPMAAAAPPAGDPAADPAKDPTKCGAPADAEITRLRAQVATLEKGKADELVKLRATVDGLQRDKDAADLAERKTLVASLVKLGAELPATAWEGDVANQKPVARLLSEPLDGLRARVTVLSGARPFAPERPTAEVVTLTADQERHVKRLKMTAEQRETYIQRLSARGGK